MAGTETAKNFNVAHELIANNAASRGDKIAIYCGDEKVTYKELDRNINRFANVLKGMGISPTDRVMIVMPDSPMFVLCVPGQHKVQERGQSRQTRCLRKRITSIS